MERRPCDWERRPGSRPSVYRVQLSPRLEAAARRRTCPQGADGRVPQPRRHADPVRSADEKRVERQPRSSRSRCAGTRPNSIEAIESGIRSAASHRGRRRFPVLEHTSHATRSTSSEGSTAAHAIRSSPTEWNTAAIAVRARTRCSAVRLVEPPHKRNVRPYTAGSGKDDRYPINRISRYRIGGDASSGPTWKPRRAASRPDRPPARPRTDSARTSRRVRRETQSERPETVGT